MKTGLTHYVVDFATVPEPWSKVAELLESLGYAGLRNLYSQELIDQVAVSTSRIFGQPSLGGSVGYYRKDPYKRLFDTFLADPGYLQVILDPGILNAVERYLGGAFTLTETNLKHDDGAGEVYFPLHADFAPGWKMHSYAKSLTEADLRLPVAVGGLMYLHDTTDGAFCYAEGTHRLGAAKGNAIRNYPAEVRREITDKLVRIEGRKGDLVLFDDRGFHGPEQPVGVARTVLLFDFYKNDVFGRATKAPLPMFINDLGGLDEHQLEVLGLGAPSMTSFASYHTHDYDVHPTYRYVKTIFEGLFGIILWKRAMVRKIKSLTGLGTNLTMYGD